MRKTLFTVALLGLLVSSYLAYEYITQNSVLCLTGSSCDVVRLSSYASFLGLPTPVWGVMFYLMLELGAIMLVPGPHLKFLRWGLTVWTGIGLAVSAVLTYIEFFVLHALCSWCLASAFLSVLAFIFVWFRLPKHEIQ